MNQLRRATVPLTLYALVIACALYPSCAKAPPTLSPAASRAYYAARVVKALDLVRDTAIAANEQTPPLVSTANTRIVIDFHESALRTIRAVPDGWKAVVTRGLDELPARLGPEYAQIEPYVNLVKAILAEVQP